jgi:hypothetical protein
MVDAIKRSLPEISGRDRFIVSAMRLCTQQNSIRNHIVTGTDDKSIE